MLRFGYKVYRLPFRAPVRTNHGVWTERKGILVRVEGEDGSVGFGEIAPIEWFGTETVEEAEEVCRKFGGEVSADVVEQLPARLGCVRFALSMALAEASRADESAKAATSPARLPVAALLPAGRAALDVLAKRLEAGYLAFKWKVGVARAEEELPLLDDLLGRLPGYAKLRLDANGAWDRRTAERWLERCAERPIEFVEQPTEPERVDLLLGLAEDYPVTLALDEAVASLVSARMWQERGWPGVFVLKPALAGPWSELAAWIEATRADVVFSSALETALGRAQILRRVLAGGMTKRALGFGVGELFGTRSFDGPQLGPLLDSSWPDGVVSEQAWNAVT